MAKPFGITLPITLGSNGYFSSAVSAQEQIRSNLKNLLLTRKGERPFQPSFGTGLYNTVFEMNVNEAIVQAKAEIQTAVALWMPFIKIDEITMRRDGVDGHDVTLTIKYTVLTGNINDTITLEI